MRRVGRAAATLLCRTASAVGSNKSSPPCCRAAHGAAEPLDGVARGPEDGGAHGDAIVAYLLLNPRLKHVRLGKCVALRWVAEAANTFRVSRGVTSHIVLI